MSKRDDDSSSDMEVGMTTAERRRRRRRGSLRVPSDNVPRRSTTPPVVAPVPEDPSLAMSIAYSFTSDASEPVPLATIDPPSARAAAASYPEPMAPEAMPTVIDPPSAPVESADFETQTREMTAVDLEALGLSEAAMSNPSLRIKTEPGVPAEASATPTIIVESQSAPVSVPRPSNDRNSDLEIEVNIDSGEVEATNGDARAHAAVPVATPPAAPQSGPVRLPPVKERHKTVALSEEDLEEVREAVRAYTEQPPLSAPPAATPPPGKDPLPSKQDLAAKLQQLTREREAEIAQVQAQAQAQAARVPTLEKPLGKSLDKTLDEPMSVPDIDIQELERDAEQSGEFELDVQMEDKSGPHTAEPEPRRAKASSVPPPVAPAAAATNPGVAPAAHAAPPPPPPAAQHKAPPVPPPAPAKKEPPKPAALEKAPQQATARQVSEQKPRGKPWFVDLFDEDYLRTLPFLTPQATQAEAEFVIQAMGLTPGAQVLDVGCGYGRHAMELAARGFHVVGLDLSTSLLVRGGEEAQRRGLQINFVRGDMRELDFEAQFDGAYCLFSTFGYFDDETNKKTVTNIARALKPGGRVLIEILNRDYVIADLPTRVWWEGDGCVVLEEVELNYFSSRIQVNRSVVFDDGRQLEQEISVRAYSLHEIGKLMHAAGFRVLEVSGAYQTRGRFFGNQSRHIIVLAERKDTSAG